MGGPVRVADALLRSLGGRNVLLHIPAPATQGDTGEELGLAVPGFQDVQLGPAVFRKVRPRVTSGERPTPARYELLVSASAVQTIVGSLDYESAHVLFGRASGAVVDGNLLEITSVTSSEAFGVVYLYRLMLRGTAADLV